MDWSTRNVVDLMEVTLMSAGTLSPTTRNDTRTNLTKLPHFRMHAVFLSVPAEMHEINEDHSHIMQKQSSDAKYQLD